MNNPDFTDFKNWHSSGRNEAEDVLFVDKLPRYEDPVQQLAINDLAQYLPPKDGSAAVSSHTVDGDKIFQRGHGQFNSEMLAAMESLRLTHFVPNTEQPYLFQDNLDIPMDSNNPDSWKIKKWRVDFGPARGDNLPVNVDPLFYYDTVSWRRILRYPDGTVQDLVVDTLYGWTIYRHNN